ncbi:MAG: phosphoribosylanthranilate isomerase [Candidatus Dormiibacterota bacterium]
MEQADARELRARAELGHPPADPQRLPQLGANPSERRTRVKICGCQSAAEVAQAVEAGADAVGLILAPSPRQVTPAQAAAAAAAAPPQVTVVGVFVDPSEAELEHAFSLLPRMIPQFSGSEPPSLCRYLRIPYLKVIPVYPHEPGPGDALRAELERFPEALPVFETASAQRGGSGRAFDWSRVRALTALRPAVISGGLGPANVGDCVRSLRPYAVDVRSGVESGTSKDPAKLKAFMQAVRSADAAT